MDAKLPQMTEILIAIGTTARSYILVGFGGLILGIIGFRFWARGQGAQMRLDSIKMHTPLLGDMWLKYQVAQFARVLGTLLVGGIPLVQALETAAHSLGTRLLQFALEKAQRLVREGQPLSQALVSTKIFPGLAIDMIEVGESTGALPQMLGSVAEFYEEDVSTRMTATLSLIEPVIMVFMGLFVAFVLVALYLPIFSLAETM
jgi:type IV pilus assembly protein PilC